jgi:hypothetical protein
MSKDVERQRERKKRKGKIRRDFICMEKEAKPFQTPLAPIGIRATMAIVLTLRDANHPVWTIMESC